MTRLAGLMLLLAALPILFIGLWFLLYAIAFMEPCVPDAPICRSSWPTGFVLAALIIGVGIAHGAIGIGIIRRNRWAQVAGLVICIGALFYAAYLVQSAFTPISFIDLDPTRPGLEPMYNNNLIASILVALAYGSVAVVLLVGSRRGFRRTEPGPIPTRHTD